MAEAELRPNELQDFADHVGELRRAASPGELTFRLKIELDGRGKLPGQETVAKLNDLLAKVSKVLALK